MQYGVLHIDEDPLARHLSAGVSRVLSIWSHLIDWYSGSIASLESGSLEFKLLIISNII